jgi:hypothetical protein
MLGVTGGMTRGRPDDAEDPIMPEKLKQNWDETIYADFEVCPFTKEKVGEMQMVCIESASNILVRKND